MFKQTYMLVWALLHVYTAIMRVVFLFCHFHALYSYLQLELYIYYISSNFIISYLNIRLVLSKMGILQILYLLSKFQYFINSKLILKPNFFIA